MGNQALGRVGHPQLVEAAAGILLEMIRADSHLL
jgi:hypothetical protein